MIVNKDELYLYGLFIKFNKKENGKKNYVFYSISFSSC